MAEERLKPSRSPEDVGLYPPSEDTFLLARFIASKLSGARVAVDVGCGSGLSSLELSRKCEYLVAVDVSAAAVSAAKELLRQTFSDVLLTDRLSPFRNSSFDVAVANPPYLPCDYSEEPLWCGGEGGIEFAVSVLRQARWSLKPGGSLFVLLSSLSDVERFLREAALLGFKAEVVHEEPIGLFEKACIVRVQRDVKT